MLERVGDGQEIRTCLVMKLEEAREQLFSGEISSCTQYCKGERFLLYANFYRKRHDEFSVLSAGNALPGLSTMQDDARLQRLALV